MRVGFDLTPWFHPHTGIGLCTRQLVEGTRQAGHDVVGLLSAWRRRPVPPGPPLPPVGRSWVPRELNRLFFDLIRWPTVETFLGPLDRFVATNYILPPPGRARSLALVHDIGRLSRPDLYGLRQVARYLPAIRRCARNAALLVVPSRAVATEVLERGLAGEERVRVLPLAARPMEPGSPPAGTPDGPLLLLVSSRERRKNLAQAVGAFGDVADAVPHHLAVVGIAPRDADDLRALVPAAHAARVVPLGRVSDAELAALYARADLTLCPSLHEGFGLPVLEAMQHGSPVLASDIAAHREVGDGAARYVVAGDRAALGEGLVDLARDPDARAALRADGLERSREFDWGRTRAAFERLLSE